MLQLPPKSSDGRLLQVWRARLLLIIAPGSGDNTSKEIDLKFYYSIKGSEDSLEVIGAIIEEMLLHKELFNYSLAPMWELMLRPAYYRLLHNSQTPSVLIEVRRATALEASSACLSDRIAQGIARYFQVLPQASQDNNPGNYPYAEPVRVDGLQDKTEEPSPSDQGDVARVGVVAKEESAEMSAGMKMPTEEIPAEAEGKPAQEQYNRELSPEPDRSLHSSPNQSPKGARPKARPRYWSGNPLAPPEDAPIYYIKHPNPGEATLWATPAFRTSTPTTDNLKSLEELVSSLKRINKPTPP